MAKRSERHPSLIRAILLGNGLRDVESLAKIQGVSEKTIRRDIQELRKLGFPIEECNGERGRKTYSICPDAVPLKFTFDEAAAVLWYCEHRRALACTPWGDSLRIAVEKVKAALGPVEKRYVSQMLPRLHRTEVNGDYRRRGQVVEALTLGIEDSRATFVTYHSARSTEPVTYDIHPYALADHRGTLYVVGHSCHHDEIRTWKVDRMLDAEATQVIFQRPKDFDVRKYFQGAFSVVVGKEPVHIRIRFSGAASRYVQEKQMHPSQQVVLHSPGVTEVTFDLTSTFEIKSWILSFGASAEVLTPESLRQEIQQELAVALHLYPQSINQ